MGSVDVTLFVVGESDFKKFRILKYKDNTLNVKKSYAFSLLEGRL